MKGKIATKTLIITLLAIVVFAVAAVGTVVFLRDDGEASAAEEGVGTLPVTGADGENNVENSNNEGEDLINPDDGENLQTENNESNVTDVENTDNEGEAITTGTTGENLQYGPAVTTVEEERLVAEETMVGWVKTTIEADYNTRAINYNNLRYVVEYYYDGVKDDEKTDVIEGNAEGDVINTYEDKPERGYEFLEVTDKDGNLFEELVISKNEKDNIIKVYYESPKFEIVKDAEITKKAEGNTVQGKAEVGDIITYTITIFNTGNVPLKQVVVTDEKLGETATIDVTVEEGSKPAIIVDYIVKPEDVNNKETIDNIAVAKLYDEKKDDDATVPVEIKKDFDIVKTAEIIAKAEGNTVQDKAEVGDTIRYTIIISNIGNTDLTGIIVTDEKLNRTETVDITVAEGSKTAIVQDYTVTQEDIDNQIDIYNIAYATLDNTTKNDDAEVPVIEATPTVYIKKDIDAITVDGTTTQIGNIDVSNIKMEMGDTVTYKIVAKNEGKATLSNVQITDNKTVVLNSVTLPERLSDITITTGRTVTANRNLLANDNITLQPGEEITLLVSYTLVKADVVGTNYHQKFVNTAYITGTHNNVNYSDNDNAEIDTEFIQETGSITFNKVWGDTGYEAIRPESIQIQLYQGQTKYGNPVTVTKSSWTKVWNDLPLEDTNGNRITYRVEELNVPDSYTVTGGTMDSNGKITLTNTYKKPTGGTIVKNWTSTSTTQIEVPLDVVFIVDTSSSMIDGGSTRATNTVSAVNSAMASILSYNNNNRVAVVGFSESGYYEGTINSASASVLLRLGRYTATNNEYLTLNDRIISTNVNQLPTQNTRRVEQGTYTQAGIQLGAEQLINSSDKTVTINGQSVKRVPIIILLSDGEPSFYTTSYNDVSNGPKLGAGLLTGDIIPNGKAEYGYYTILSANYYKGLVSGAYHTTAKMFTIAMDLSTHYGNTVLNPTSGNVTTCQNHAELISKNLYKYLKEGYNGTANPYAGAYQYADSSYSGTMSTSALQSAMQGFITSTINQNESKAITADEINAGKISLPNLKIDGAFTLKVNGTNVYNNVKAQNAINDNVIAGNATDGYYLDLTKVTAGATINISYTVK